MFIVLSNSQGSNLIVNRVAEDSEASGQDWIQTGLDNG